MKIPLPKVGSLQVFLQRLKCRQEFLQRGWHLHSIRSLHLPSAVSSVDQPASNVQVQPTQSGQISPIGLLGATSAMDAPTTYVPEGQQG